MNIRCINKNRNMNIDINVDIASEGALVFIMCINFSNALSPAFAEGLTRQKVVDSEEPGASLQSQQRLQNIL